MDVRCERCKTEYEFDDARITEAGVTVKCTTCSHVFKVKKQAAGGASPEHATEIGTPNLPPPPSASAASVTSSQEKPREWKVKQSNGNVFTFKELTTLQKWIVERKVSRDDEISLTGESWKRLGNIAELASFFQVVEEASKATQLSALQSGGYLAYSPPVMTPSGGYPAMPTVPPPQPQAPPPAPPPAPPQATAFNIPIDVTGVVPTQVPPPPPPAPAPVKNATLSFGQPSPALSPPPAPRKAQVMSAQRRTSSEDDEELEAAGLGRKRGGGGAGKFLLVLLLLALVGGGGYYGYFEYYLPIEAKKAEDQRADAERAAREAKEKEAAAAALLAVERHRLSLIEDAGVPDAGEPYVDAGEPYIDAGTPVVVKKEPVRDFDWFLAQGDRLRDREKPEAALDMYGKAADLQPDRAEPYAGRGLAMLDMGQKAPAEASFQQALKLNPRYGEAIMGLAETYRAMDRKADAIKYYERYLDVQPNGAEAPVATEAIRRLKSE